MGEPILMVGLAHVELPVSLLSPPTQPSTTASTSTAPSSSNVPVVSLKKENKKKHHLTTSTDPLFAELRDLNFASVGKRLNKVAHRLDQDYKVFLMLSLIVSLISIFGGTTSSQDCCSTA